MPTRDGPAAQRGELADAVGGVLDARAGCARRARRTRGRPRSATTPRPGADEEVGAERLLELADLLGDRGLRDAQRLGGGGERAELERRAEAADLLQRQKLSFGLRQGSQAYLAEHARARSCAHDARRGDRRRRDRRAVGGVAAAPPRRAAAGGRRSARRPDALGPVRRLLAQLRRAPVPRAGLAGRRAWRASAGWRRCR